MHSAALGAVTSQLFPDHWIRKWVHVRGGCSVGNTSVHSPLFNPLSLRCTRTSKHATQRASRESDNVHTSNGACSTNVDHGLPSERNPSHNPSQEWNSPHNTAPPRTETGKGIYHGNGPSTTAHYSGTKSHQDSKPYASIGSPSPPTPGHSQRRGPIHVPPHLMVSYIPVFPSTRQTVSTECFLFFEGEVTNCNQNGWYGQCMPQWPT